MVNTNEGLKMELDKTVGNLNDAVAERNETEKFFLSQIEKKHQTLHDEINQTLQMKDELNRVDNEIEAFFASMNEIVEMLECDTTAIKSMLGENNKITVENVHLYLRTLEQKLSDILAFVYCEEREGMDILVESSKLTVGSLKRADEKPVKLTDVILTTQCPECAELVDVNQFDDKLVEMIDDEEVHKKMIENYYKPEMESRMHNLLSCNLPRSGVIASRRYAE